MPPSDSEPPAPQGAISNKTRFLSGAIIFALIILGTMVYSKQGRPTPPIQGVSENASEVKPQSTASLTELDGGNTTYVPALTPEQLSSMRSRLGTTTPRVMHDTYGLFVFPLGIEMSDYIESGAKYYDDGTIESGQFAGYHRVIAEVPQDGPGEPQYYTFATKDYETFVLHSDYEGRSPNPNVFNSESVTSAANFPTSFPDLILMGKFTLVRGQLRTRLITSSSTPVQYSFIADRSANDPSAELASPVPGLRLYSSGRTSAPLRLPETLPTSTQERYGLVLGAYVRGSTDVLAASPSGLQFFYNLSFAPFADYNSPTSKKPSSEYEHYGYLSVEPVDPAFYEHYGLLYPQGCGGGDTTRSYVVTNISDDEFRNTGIIWQGAPLYVLKDRNHLIAQVEHDTKVEGKATMWNRDERRDDQVPSYEAYSQKYPMLFFKDPWGRWVVLGEQDWMLPGGCGKPVIYLYPPKPTQVSVQFVRPPTFYHDIPAYNGSWDVLTEPNGILTDSSGSYPYLYWSGQANGEYPVPRGGWVMARNTIENFLQAKLEVLGLTKKEQEDMLSYWVPELLKNSALYYRISFFTTEQMNDFVPMRVTPHPESTLRIFLDWSPLASVPEQQPLPQQLVPFERKGFTLVEWGGLRR